MLSALLWLLAGLALLLLLILCTPLRLHVWFNSGAASAIRVRIGLFGGLVPIPVTPGAGPKKPKKDKAKKKKKKKRGSGPNIPRLIRAGPRLISGLLHTIKIEKLRATVGFGFDNPADTGMVYGMLTPIERAINGHKTRIALHPDFDRAKLDGTGEFAARFTPVTILPPLFGFGWNVFLHPKLPRAFQ